MTLKAPVLCRQLSFHDAMFPSPPAQALSWDARRLRSASTTTTTRRRPRVGWTAAASSHAPAIRTRGCTASPPGGMCRARWRWSARAAGWMTSTATTGNTPPPPPPCPSKYKPILCHVCHAFESVEDWLWAYEYMLQSPHSSGCSCTVIGGAPIDCHGWIMCGM